MDKLGIFWLLVHLLVVLKPYFVISDTVTYVEAFLNISYTNGNGEHFLASGHGHFGSGGPFKPVSGTLVSFKNKDWCSYFPSKPIPGTWIALIPRGNCTFRRKIAHAKLKNASAVIIYNYGRRSDDFIMATSASDKIVSVSISRNLGSTLVSLQRTNTRVDVGIIVISIKKRHGITMSQFMRLFLPLASVMILLSALALLHRYRTKRKRRKECLNKLSQLVTKVFAGDDEDDTCVICIDTYRKGQTLRVLHCGHRFHKRCVDPWILQRDTCPICKRSLTLASAEEGNAEPRETPEAANLAPNAVV